MRFLSGRFAGLIPDNRRRSLRAPITLRPVARIAIRSMVIGSMLLFVGQACWAQELVRAIGWEFESPLPHQQISEFAGLSASRLSGESTGPSRTWPKPYLVADLLAGYGDAVTTYVNLANGGHELNPLMPQTRVANAIATATAYTGVAVGAWLLDRHGHHRLAAWLGWSGTAAGVSATAHNAGVFRWPGERR